MQNQNIRQGLEMQTLQERFGEIIDRMVWTETELLGKSKD